MKFPKNVLLGSVLIATMLLLLSFQFASAQQIPDWVKNVAKWYGDGEISETAFLNAIKFLIENDIIILDEKSETDIDEEIKKSTNVIIPNGNSEMGNAGFYIPLNLEVNTGTTVVWINDDVVGHTVQSQDGEGNVISLFNSDILNTGDRFAYTFDEAGAYNYFCTIHPWRVGVITVK